MRWLRRYGGVERSATSAVLTANFRMAGEPPVERSANGWTAFLRTAIDALLLVRR
jgi:predicted NodU family carbamoyl transferase